jgi:hypothetical protein
MVLALQLYIAARPAGYLCRAKQKAQLRSAVVKRAQDALRGERGLAQTRSDGIEDRVSNRRAGRDRRRFSGAHRLHGRLVDEHDLDRKSVV